MTRKRQKDVPQLLLTEGMREILTIRERILPTDWIEKHMVLSRSYATQGKIVLIPWQRAIPDAIVEYDELILIAPVQTGKSMIEEGLFGYCVDQAPQNALIVYEKRETVEDVFDERLKPLITETPALNQYWDGDPDNLTKRRIKLRHMVARVGSASTRSDIASHNAGFVIGDEVAKWAPRGAQKFDPLKLLQGRTHATRMLGRNVKYVFATSPRTDGDPSYKLAHRQGTRFLRPHYKCPHCKQWQTLVDAQVKEIPNADGEFDHNPERIRDERAARYECIACGKEITEAQRVGISEKVVWAAVDPKTDKTVEVITPRGKVQERIEARRVVFNWNRLVDVTWTFSECLAAYFEALQSADGATLADYQNEDMARWVKITGSARYSETWLMKRARKAKYKQFGADAYVPDPVVVLLAGIDTQDDGFYFVLRGFGPNMESWLIRADFAHCPMDQGDYVNPAKVHELLLGEITRYTYQKRNGAKVPILMGLIDRGGHRSDDVDYIVRHSTFLKPYIGATRRDGPLVRRSDRGIYMGNTRALSRTVEKQMQSDIWHLPRDIQPEYCAQVLNQYDEEYTDTRGNTKTRWVSGDDTGKPDHYRDCENLIVGTAVVVDMQGMMFSDTGQATMKKAADRLAGRIEDRKDEEKRPEPGEDNEDRITFGGTAMDDFLKGGGW